MKAFFQYVRNGMDVYKDGLVRLELRLQSWCFLYSFLATGVPELRTFEGRKNPRVYEEITGNLSTDRNTNLPPDYGYIYILLICGRKLLHYRSNEYVVLVTVMVSSPTVNVVFNVFLRNLLNNCGR